MKYMVLMHPKGSETYILDEEFATVDDAVRAALVYGTADFWVVTKVEWEAKPNK